MGEHSKASHWVGGQIWDSDGTTVGSRLAQAEALATEVSTGAQSELGLALARVRKLLAR